MKNFMSKRIILEPQAGVNISECIKEATIMAMQESSTVTFTFNQTHYEINPWEIIDNVYKKGNESS